MCYLRVAIVGGKLQGIEAAYLSHELGWKVFLIDNNPDVPAKGLCDSFYQCDIVKDVSNLCQIIKKVDLIIPALEDVVGLKSLHECATAINIPLAYDHKAHFITRSKKRSNRFFERLGLPVPQPWPQCGFPAIVKPSSSSGSKGVDKLCTEKELDDFFNRLDSTPNRLIIQEYLEGPSYSLEVFGFEDHFEVLQITELEMDDLYDCKRVLAPPRISESMEGQFKEVALTIAKELQLKGIMDVEVICQKGDLKLLEIDARLPSQTPTVVYKSTGINMLELLRDVFIRESLPTLSDMKMTRGVVYEHIRVSENGLEVLGEHILADVKSLKVIDDFFGADVSITNFNSSGFPWVATLIITGENREQAWLKHCQVIENIKNYLGEPLISKQ